MIRYLARVLIRSLMDLALVALLVAGLLGFIAFKLLRRLVQEDDSYLERKALIVVEALTLLARVVPRPGSRSSSSSSPASSPDETRT